MKLRLAFSHHFEILGAAFHSSVVAGQQHVFDVVTRAVVELAHVKRAGLKAGEIRFILQGHEDALLHQVCVPDLISDNKHKTQTDVYFCTKIHLKSDPFIHLKY